MDTPGTSVDVTVNGHSVGSTPVGSEWSEASFVIRADTLVADGVQMVGLRSSNGNEFGYGVALSSARIDEL